jgi:hypothetical protein
MAAVQGRSGTHSIYINTCNNEHHQMLCVVVSTLASYFGSLRFESRPWQWLSWLRIFMDFLSSFRHVRIVSQNISWPLPSASSQFNIHNYEWSSCHLMLYNLCSWYSHLHMHYIKDSFMFVGVLACTHRADI